MLMTDDVGCEELGLAKKCAVLSWEGVARGEYLPGSLSA